MPDLFFSQALTANQVAFRPLASWRYRRLPYPARVTILVRATGAAAGVRFSVLTGTTELVQRSPVSVGGTAGVMPVPQTTPVVQFNADAGDELDLSIDEVAGATPTVDGWVNAEPL